MTVFQIQSKLHHVIQGNQQKKGKFEQAVGPIKIEERNAKEAIKGHLFYLNSKKGNPTDN